MIVVVDVDVDVEDGRCVFLSKIWLMIERKKYL